MRTVHHLSWGTDVWFETGPDPEVPGDTYDDVIIETPLPLLDVEVSCCEHDAGHVNLTLYGGETVYEMNLNDNAARETLDNLRKAVNELTNLLGPSVNALPAFPAPPRLKVRRRPAQRKPPPDRDDK